MLRIFQPLAGAVTVPAEAGTKALQAAVVECCIAPKVRRACERDPSSSDCLTREELAAVAVAVAVPVRL